MKYLSNEEIKDLHNKYAPSRSAFDEVYIHSKIVLEIANRLIDLSKPSVDKELVRVGILLHDVGVYKLYGSNGEIDDSRYIEHGILGYELLKKEGFDEALCRFASHHTGVGITKEEIIKRELPLPKEDFLAESEEEVLVMYADKFHSKTEPPVFNTFDYYKRYIKRFGEGNVVKFEGMGERFGIPEIESMAKHYNQELRS